MSKQFADVIEFNKKVINLKPTEYLSEDRLAWFKGVINEELGEFEAANKKYSEKLNNSSLFRCLAEDELLEIKAEMADAIIDLLYFAYGRLFEIGITEVEFNYMWQEIQKANMAKVKGNKGRGSDDDAIKPRDWQAPEKNFLNVMKSSREIRLEDYYDDDCTVPSTDPMEASVIRAIDEDKPIDGHPMFDHKPGMKYDEGKPNLSLVFGGFNKALLDVGYIGTFGARKYTPNGWREVKSLVERYTSALLRHLFAAMSPRVEDIYDNETGRLHLAHVAWNALALTEHLLKTIDYDKYNAEALAQSEETLRKHFEGKSNG